MKYRNRKTGEIVDIISFSTLTGTDRHISDNVSYIDSKGEEHKRVEGNLYWDFEPVDEIHKEIDWEQRRYEIAKEVYLRLIFQDYSPIAIEDAVEYADDLINELKKGGQE